MGRCAWPILRLGSLGPADTFRIAPNGVGATMRRGTRGKRALQALVTGGLLLMLALPAAASAKGGGDPTIIARNILPSGQFQTNSGPPASAEAQMYNALTPLFDHVTQNDLFTDFKSEKLSVDTDG